MTSIPRGSLGKSELNERACSISAAAFVRQAGSSGDGGEMAAISAAKDAAARSIGASELAAACGEADGVSGGAAMTHVDAKNKRRIRIM
jgi:hypothetical protein